MREQSMEIDQVLRMNGGTGDESYAKNSISQKAHLSKSMPIVEEAVVCLCTEQSLAIVTIADLGCSSGPNTFAAVSGIMTAFFNKCRQLGLPSPEFQVFLNDLPGNDFNSVFRSLPAFRNKLREEGGNGFGPCYVTGVPGSFYGRLFPSQSLNFVHSSNSLHWLSKVPPELWDGGPLNKGKIYLSKTSPPAVINAYAAQFQRDFSSFLKSRSQELAPGGRMVLSFRGRTTKLISDKTCILWDLLAQALQELVSKGLVSEERLDSCNVPYYDACTEEVISEMGREGSFQVDRIGKNVIPWDTVVGPGRDCDKATISQQLAKAMRAVQEPILQTHFGSEIMEGLFQRLGQLIAANVTTLEHVNIVVCVTRKA